MIYEVKYRDAKFYVEAGLKEDSLVDFMIDNSLAFRVMDNMDKALLSDDVDLFIAVLEELMPNEEHYNNLTEAISFGCSFKVGRDKESPNFVCVGVVNGGNGAFGYVADDSMISAIFNQVRIAFETHVKPFLQKEESNEKLKVKGRPKNPVNKSNEYSVDIIVTDHSGEKYASEGVSNLGMSELDIADDIYVNGFTTSVDGEAVIISPEYIGSVRVKRCKENAV
jgi:hypothetical protein